MNRSLLSLLLALLCVTNVWAQKWEIDPLVVDSLECYQVVLKDTVWQHADGAPSVMIPRGMVIDSIEGRTKSEVVFLYEGRYYRAYKSGLRWSSENPDSVTHYQDAWDARSHTDLGHWCASTSPLKLILLIFFLTAIVGWVGAAWEPMRKVAIVGVPLGILAASGIELLMFFMLGTDAFWWCDYDRYGFFGSLGRVIPFGLAVAYQVYSIYQFDDVMFPEEGLQISVKPAALAIGGVVPILIVYLLIVNAWLGYRGQWMEIGALVIFFGTLILGIGWALTRNIQAMGKIGGIAATIFSIIYIFACLLSICAIGVLIIRLFVQILIAIFVLFFLAAMGTRVYRGSDGHLYEDTGFGRRRVD